jgi:hypothetical protein
VLESSPAIAIRQYTQGVLLRLVRIWSALGSSGTGGGELKRAAQALPHDV